MTSTPRICILGGGFGGLYTALRLKQFDWGTSKPEIILIDRQEQFVFSPLLYELVTGELQTWEVAPAFSELLAGTDIKFQQGSASDIDSVTKTLTLTDGQQINYDRLVVAVGGETPLDAVAGAAEHAIAFRTVADARRLEEKLRVLERSDREKIRVAIVGAGYSGVELACKLADRLGSRGRIRLVELGEKILPAAPEFNRKAAEQALEQRGVWIDLETSVQSIAADEISLNYRNTIDMLPVEIVMWTVGTQVSEIVAKIPTVKNSRGRIIVEPTLAVPDLEHVFALGDAAEVKNSDDGRLVPATAQAALQQADFAAWNVWSSLTDRPLLPFRYTNLGEMMALGTNNAVLSGLGIQLAGPAAYLARRLVYLYRLPTLEHQIKVGFNWLTQPLVELANSIGKAS
jgi:demethylphylloquinone reductase